MDRQIWKSLKSFLAELAVYGALVVGYYFLVLHALGGWLYRIFQQDRHFYAALALVFIIVQGVALETLTRWLLAWLKPRKEPR